MKLKFLAVYLFLSYCAFSQDSTKTKQDMGFGVSFMTMLSLDEYDFLYVPSFFYFKNRHTMAFGPLIGPDLLTSYSGSDAWRKGGNTINGFNVCYQYRPNPKAKRFDLYFQSMILWRKYFGYSTFENKSLGFIPFNYKITKIDKYIGYGFSALLFENLYVKQSTGLGIQRYGFFVNYPTKQISIKEVFYNDFLVMIDLGLSDKFKYYK